MQVKILEVRDRMTFLPVMAVLVRPTNFNQEYLLRRAGFITLDTYVVLTKLTDLKTAYDEDYGWGDRTMTTAHKYIHENWDKLADGAVVDVEFILGETSEPKQSELVESIHRSL
jgi:hypothetical protein